MIIPTKYDAYSGSPTEWFLKSKLNPETQDLKNSEAIESGNFCSDDASLSEFMKKLIQVINKKENKWIFIIEYLRNLYLLYIYYKNIDILSLFIQ